MVNNINQLQENTTDKKSDSALTFNARRRLIKGTAIALPVVMTLRSGAAMAASSTESCIARDQKLADTLNPIEFTEVDTDPFLRTPITITRLIKIKEVTNIGGNNPKWVYDTQPPGNALQYSIVYVHGHGLTAPLPSNWLNTADPQLPFTNLVATIDVYNVYTDTTPAITAGNHFKQGLNNFVQDASFGINGLMEQYGLVVTDGFGGIQTDALGGPRVGQFVNHPDLQANNHLTGSCWNSLNPNVP